MRLITPILLFFVLFITKASAQDSTLIVSQPIDIPQDGWNKVLQLSNGNTMLFHFENRKKPRLFIYNNKGELISTVIDEYKLIDMNRLDLCELGGLFEIDGVINLILYCQRVSDVMIVRMQYDFSGKKVSEAEVEKPEGVEKIVSANTLHVKGDKDYHIVSYSHEMAMDSVVLSICTYSANHILKRHIAYKIANKDIDGVGLLSTTLSKSGSVYAAIITSKRQKRSYGKATLHLLHVPANYSYPIVSNFALPEHNRIEDLYIRENSFTNTINYYFTHISDIEEQQKLGLFNWLPYETMSLLVTNPDLTIEKETNITFDMVKKSITDGFGGDTIKGNRKLPFLNYVFTDENGVTTVLQHEVWYRELKNAGKQVYWNNFFVTKFDDNGSEMYGAALPTGKHIIDYRSYNDVMGYNINKVYQESFVLKNKKNVFTIFNDNRYNFDKLLKDEKSDIIEYKKTDAVYYQIGKKNAITKRYLLGEGVDNEYRQICTYTQDFDENANLLAAVARIIKGDKETLHMVWKRLD